MNSNVYQPKNLNLDHSVEAYLARQAGKSEMQQKEKESGQKEQDHLTSGETQAERVWNLMSGHYNLSRYRPPEADVVKNEWDENPECVRLFEQIWNMSNKFMNEEAAEELRNCVYDLTKAFAIKMFEYREVLKNTPLELDRVVFELMARDKDPEPNSWEEGIEDMFKKPAVQKRVDDFCEAWARVEKRLNVEPEEDPDLQIMVNAHMGLLELFSRQAFRYGQIFRI